MWSLFAISITFVALRFLARTKTLDGPGFGADDWTMLVVLVFIFPHEIGLEMSEYNLISLATKSDLTNGLQWFKTALGKTCG